MIRASAVAQGDPEGRTLVVTTSDALHRLYRLTFETARNAADFQRLADAAEAASAAASPGDAAASTAEAESKLEEGVRTKLADRTPILYSGVELYGPDPGVPGSTSEVLLGRGVAVLLDPTDDGRVGSYELLFYGEDEGPREPLKRITVGPRMQLKRQQPDSEEAEGPAASFELSSGQAGGIQPHTLAFDRQAVADSFARDFRVRARLMDLSLKTVRGAKAADRLRDELEEMKQRSLAVRIMRIVRLLVLLLVLGVVIRLAVLYQADKGTSEPAVYLKQVAGELRNIGGLSRTVVTTVGSKVCELTVGAIPAADVRRCAALAMETKAGGLKAKPVLVCLEALVGPV